MSGRRRRAWGAGLGALLAAGNLLAAEPPEAAALPLPGERSLYVLDIPVLHLAPLDAEPPAAGSATFEMRFAHGNTFSHTWHPHAYLAEKGRLGGDVTAADAQVLHLRHPQDTILFLDAEATRVSLRLGLGLGNGWAVALEVPWLSYSAVRSDAAIERLHRAIGATDQQRPAFARGRFVLWLQRPGGEPAFVGSTPGAGLGDTTLALRFARPVAADTNLEAEAVVKLPTGDPESFRGSGSVDGGLVAGLTRRLGETRRVGLHLEAGLVLPGAVRTPIPLDARLFGRLLLAGDVRLGRSTFVSLSVLAEQSPYRAERLADVARTGVEAILGVSRRLSRTTTASLSLSENLPWFGDATDLAVALRVAYAP